MMYYVLRITRTGETIAKEIFDFTDFNQARSNYFYFLSSCYANSELGYFMAEILDIHGNVLYIESYERQAAE